MKNKFHSAGIDPRKIRPEISQCCWQYIRILPRRVWNQLPTQSSTAKIKVCCQINDFCRSRNSQGCYFAGDGIMGIFNIKYICKSLLPSHSGSDKKSPPAGMCEQALSECCCFLLIPILATPWLLISYLVVFPLPEDVVRQLEVDSLLSEVLPWNKKVCKWHTLTAVSPERMGAASRHLARLWQGLPGLESRKKRGRTLWEHPGCQGRPGEEPLGHSPGSCSPVLLRRGLHGQ